LAIVFGTVFTKFMVNFGEEIGDFLLCCGLFLPRKFKLILENFTFFSQGNLNPFVFRPITNGELLVGSPWMVRGRIAGCMICERWCDVWRGQK